MKTKVFFLTVLFVIGLSFQNCRLFTGCDCPPTQPFFNVIGLERINHQDKDGVMVEAEETKFIDYRGIAFDFEVEFHSSVEKCSPWSFSLINSAMACECAEDGGSGSKSEQLKEITVITLNDFDDTHQANDTINDLLTIRDQDLDDFVAGSTGLLHDQGFFLQLKKAPTVDTTFKLKVIVGLSDNEVYEGESVAIKFVE